MPTVPDSAILQEILRQCQAAVGTDSEEAHGELEAIAPALAEEVIRFRTGAVEAAARAVIYCLGCGVVSHSDGDFCCLTCGRDLIALTNSDDADTVAEWDADYARAVRDLTRDRDEARKEVEELRARIDAALKILDDPDDFDDAICRANESLLWGDI